MSYTNKRKKISLHVKTDLNTDGRVLAWIDVINEYYRDMDFCVSVNADRTINFDLLTGIEINVINVKFITSNRGLFSILRLLSYAFIDFIFLLKYRPSVVIVQDKNALLAPILYSFLSSKASLIYDDHELFNFPLTLEDKLFFIIEKLAYKISTDVFVANKFRRKIISRLYKTDREILILKNFYHDRSRNGTVQLSANTATALDTIVDLRSRGKEIILHQGRITKERGEAKIFQLLATVDEKFHVCFIGDEVYDFASKHAGKNFTVLGKIPYSELSLIYKEIDFSIIFYENNFINNRYCAPNRLFMAMYFNVIIIVNKNISMLDALCDYERKLIYTGGNLNSYADTTKIKVVNKQYDFTVNNQDLIRSVITKNL